MKKLTTALMIAGVAVSLTACAGFTADNSNYVEDAEVATYDAGKIKVTPAPTADRSARIERAYNDSLRK